MSKIPCLKILKLRTCEKIRIIAPTQASPRRAVWSFDSAQDTEPAEVRSCKKSHNFMKNVGAEPRLGDLCRFFHTF